MLWKGALLGREVRKAEVLGRRPIKHYGDLNWLIDIATWRGVMSLEKSDGASSSL